jgi:TolB-like protein/Tfp pilus assembly protein PilF
VAVATATAFPVRPIRQLEKSWFALAGVVIAAALILGFYFSRGRYVRATVAPRIQSIAVLPLESLSNDPAQEYFADGMTDELVTDLASIGSLRVISRTSTLHYKGTRKTVPEIARELNVDAVVEGSVTRSPNKIRIRAQLIRAAPEEHLWAESYERDLSDVLVLQRDVATAIAAQIKINLTPEEKARFANARAINPDAYNAYLLGAFHSDKGNPASISKGIEYFQQAIRIDPSYAKAYAGLANAYFERDIWGGLGIGKSAAPIRANTLKALELDGDLADAHILMGQIHFQHDWDWPGTEREYKRAIALNPNLAYTYNRYAYFLQVVGRHQEALRAAHRAVELDPLSVPNICDEGRIFYRERQYQQAVARYQRALELDPGYLPALSRMADAYEGLGNYEEALNYAEKLKQVLGDPRPSWLPFAEIYARMGKRREAVELLRQIEKEGEASNSFALAVVYTALGDRDHAISALESGVQARSLLPIVFVDPRLDPLRADSRFQKLTRRVGLPLSIPE